MPIKKYQIVFHQSPVLAHMSALTKETIEWQALEIEIMRLKYCLLKFRPIQLIAGWSKASESPMTNLEPIAKFTL